jgi:GxxExxY protein
MIGIKHKELTEKAINIFYRVYNKLGYGFLEKVYENAMMIEFKREDILAVSQSPIRYFMKVKLWVNTMPIYWLITR